MQPPSGDKPVTPSKPIAIITQVDGTQIEALSLYLQKHDLSAVPFHPAEPKIGLPLASGVIVHFDKMSSFEIRLVKRATKPVAVGTGGEDWDVEAMITLLDGATITEKLVHRSHVAALKGAHTLGSFEVALGNIKRVDLQWQ